MDTSKNVRHKVISIVRFHLYKDLDRQKQTDDEKHKKIVIYGVAKMLGRG